MEKNTESGISERVLLLAAKDAGTLGTVRLLPGLMAAPEGECLWLRGIPAAGTPDIRLRQLPLRGAYLADGEGRLFPPGGLTPVGRLPRLHWLPLAGFLKPELPVSALPGRAEQKVAAFPAPSGIFRESTALLTAFDLFRQWAEEAPLVRLKALRYAVSSGNKVLLLGTPQPPLPGRPYWANGSLLLPCGYDFDPPLAGSLLVKKLNPHDEAILLFDGDGRWEKIPKRLLLPVTRSGVRLT